MAMPPETNKDKAFASCFINLKLDERMKLFIARNEEYSRSRFIREAITEKLNREG